MLLTLLIALSATPDAGLPIAPVELRPACKPPGIWDPRTKQCKPGCGIPVSWENGVQVGGCGGDLVPPALSQPVCKPGSAWNSTRKRCELGAVDSKP